ncbi:hypothetical protein BJ742DRAFT_839171 [Cladochytrium replicatum]|nr:hypothetical protein BJ742DRAFT_839171 [Cladochytrium replicatum]
MSSKGKQLAVAVRTFDENPAPAASTSQQPNANTTQPAATQPPRTRAEILDEIFARAEEAAKPPNGELRDFPSPDDSEVIDEVERNTLSLLYANTSAMVKAYQPKFDCTKKQAIYKKIAKKQSYDTHDQVGVVRFRGIALPRYVTLVSPNIVHKVDLFYDYKQPSTSDNIPWWVNFTDRTMFAWFHKAGLGLASEEIRAFEHPSMCSLREMLSDIGKHKLLKDESLAKKKWYNVISEPVQGGSRSLLCVPDLEQERNAYENFLPRTTDPANRPTPILVVGAKRFGRVDTIVGDEGKKENIYGDKFLKATVSQAESTVKDCPLSVNNFISIEALDKMTNPELHRGNYTIHQVRTLLRTALTGFAAARAVSRQPAPDMISSLAYPNISINTGNWGCGEYKNNKSVIAFIQCAAVAMVGGVFDSIEIVDSEDFAVFRPMVSALNYYYLDKGSEKSDVNKGIQLFKEMWGGNVDRDNDGPPLLTVPERKEMRRKWEVLKKYKSPNTGSTDINVRYVIVEKFLEEAVRQFKSRGWTWVDDEPKHQTKNNAAPPASVPPTPINAVATQPYVAVQTSSPPQNV